MVNTMTEEKTNLEELEELFAILEERIRKLEESREELFLELKENFDFKIKILEEKINGSVLRS